MSFVKAFAPTVAPVAVGTKCITIARTFAPILKLGVPFHTLVNLEVNDATTLNTIITRIITTHDRSAATAAANDVGELTPYDQMQAIRAGWLG
jgi:hypothetical protein